MASVAWDVLVENELSAATSAAATAPAPPAATAGQSDDPRPASNEPRNKEHLAEARKALRHLRGRLPSAATAAASAAPAAAAAPRERSPFNWIERRLNDENDLNEFEQMEHELGHGRDSPDAAAGPQLLVEERDQTCRKSLPLPTVAAAAASGAACAVQARVPIVRSKSIAELGDEGGRSNPLREDNPPSALVQRFFKRSLQGRAQQAPTQVDEVRQRSQRSYGAERCVCRQ